MMHSLNFARSLRFLLVASCMVSPAHAASFEDVLIATYQNNPRIKSERQKLEATDESLAQAASGFRPSISAGYERGRQRTDFGESGWSYGDSENQQLTVRQPLFRGGSTIAAYRSAQQRVKSGQHTLSAVEQNVLLEATRAYMEVVANSAILDLARTNVQVLEEQLKAAKTRFDVGEVTRTDVAQAQARLSDAKTSVIAADGQMMAAMAVFERVVGVPPEGIMIAPDSLPELPATREEALERGRAANPELMAIIAAARSSHYDVRTQEGVLLPSVSLVGSMARQKGAGSSGDASFDQDKVGVEVNIPLYQAGAEYSRVRQASATARQRDHEAIDQRLAIDQAVIQGWQELETAIATITTRQDQINAAQVALEGVKQEQEYGSRTVLDVLDAEQELFVARTNLVRAQRDRIVAAYSLAYTLGQLTPIALGLQVAEYNPTEHANDVTWKPIGF